MKDDNNLGFYYIAIENIGIPTEKKQDQIMILAQFVTFCEYQVENLTLAINSYKYNKVFLLFSVTFFIAHTNGYGTNGCQEIDDLLSDVWRVGDSNRIWPEADASLQQYCL